jgi:hypothetical protein
MKPSKKVDQYYPEISPWNTNREFINSTQFVADFPPENCFDKNTSTFCQSVRQRFPTFRIDLKQEYRLKSITVINHPIETERTLTPFVIILENRFNQQVYRQLIEQQKPEELEFKFEPIDKDVRFIVVQSGSISPVHLKIADFIIRYQPTEGTQIPSEPPPKQNKELLKDQVVGYISDKSGIDLNNPSMKRTREKIVDNIDNPMFNDIKKNIMNNY